MARAAGPCWLSRPWQPVPRGGLRSRTLIATIARRMPAAALKPVYALVGDDSFLQLQCLASVVALATWSVALLIPFTSVRSSSIVKLIESAIAPVTSSVTDA